MTSAAAPPQQQLIRKKRPSRGRRVLRGIFVAAITFTVIGLVTLYIYGSWAQRELESLKTEIRANGEPLTLVELEAFYPQIPDEENGAFAYVRAAAIEERLDQDATFSIVGEELARTFHRREETRETIAILERHVKECEPIYVALNEALPFEIARFSIDFSRTDQTAWNHTASMRRLRNVLLAQGYLAVHNRDWDTLGHSLEQMLHIATLLRDEPGFFAQYTSLMGISDSMKLVYRAIETQEAPVTLYESLEPTFAQIDLHEISRMWVSGQRAIYAIRMEAFYQGDESLFQENEQELLRSYQGYRSTPGYQKFAALETFHGLRYYTDILDDHGKPWHTRLVNALERQPLSERLYPMVAAENIENSSLPSPAFWHVLLYVLNPVDFAWYEPSDPTDIFVDYAVRIRCIRLAMKVDKFRQQHGTFPASIEELGINVDTEIGLDPVNGKPLGYALEEGGFAILGTGWKPERMKGIPSRFQGHPFSMKFLREKAEAAD